MARAPSCPGYQAARIAFTWGSQGMATGLPVSSTTIVFGLAAPTASMRASWPQGSERSELSKPSPSIRTANTIATSLRRASSAASAGLIPGSNSISAPGSRAASSSTGAAPPTSSLRNVPMIPGPPRVISTAKPPGGVTAAEPIPETTPRFA